MSPSGSPIHEPFEGDLTEPPPSDLSEYTWDDSDTQRYEPGQSDGGPASDRAGRPSRESAIEETQQFVDILIANRLVRDSDLRALMGRIFPDGDPGNVDRLSSELIRTGILTRYQAAAIRQGKTKGLVIGDYVVLDRIGSGGMGLVLKARDRRQQRIVALKLLPPSISRDRAAVIRFRREAAAVAKLRHPNIVAALDSGETHGLLFLVMELVDGKDLAKLVKERGPMTVTQAVRCILQAASGLRAAHARGIVHRDIKPANLLLDRSGTIKVLDLGLARVNQGQDMLTADDSMLNLTVSGAFVGTVDYMSPEQAYDPRLADGRSDVYSLGCTLHYLLTGKPPFGGEGFMERLLGHRERPIPSLKRLRNDVPDSIDAIFRRLLSKAPEGRPQTMTDVIEELEECQSPTLLETPGRSGAGAADTDPEDEPGSVYDIADMPAAAEPRPMVHSTVFVRTPGASDDRIDFRRARRARRGRLVRRLLILAALLIGGWYIAVRAGWIRR
jgi:serine/threonine protein kinase